MNTKPAIADLLLRDIVYANMYWNPLKNYITVLGTDVKVVLILCGRQWDQIESAVQKGNI